jgi:Na+-translocating ferredoxin:NAD+ oxidoreductase RnfD subunit
VNTEVIPQDAPDAISDLPDVSHSGISVRRMFIMHLMGALFPITAGIMLYGWRAAVLLATVVLSAAAAVFVWKQLGARGEQLRYSHTLWLATLLALTLPPHFVSNDPHIASANGALWPILPASGIFLVIFTWLLGGVGSGRVHPVLMTHLLLVVCFQHAMVPHYVLQRDDLLFGDVLDARINDSPVSRAEPWISASIDWDHDAIYTEPSAQRLIFFTSGRQFPDRTWLMLGDLLRDWVPPLEDLLIAGEPGPIGAGCTLASLIGGLFLLYRGLIDFRVPLLIFVSAFMALLILPIPIYITSTAPTWEWLAVRYVGWPVAVTFVNYEIMAGPLMFTAFYLATSPAVRPMARRARALYAVLVGVLCAVFQLYVTVAQGPYVALLIVSLLVPSLDKWFRPRALV